jgi:hypothetical protein
MDANAIEPPALAASATRGLQCAAMNAPSRSRRELPPAGPGPLQFSIAEGLLVLTILGAAFAVLAASLTAGIILLALLVPALGRTALVSHQRREAGLPFPLWESGLTLGMSLLVALIAESLLIAIALAIGAAGLMAYALVDPQFDWPGVPLVFAVVILLAIGGALAAVWFVFLGTWPPPRKTDPAGAATSR